MQIFWLYFKELYTFARAKLILNVLLMVVLGLLEGIGIVMLVPLFILAGILQDNHIDGAMINWVGRVFKDLGLTLNLPVILTAYIGIIWGQSGLQCWQSRLNMKIQQSFNSYLSIRLFQAVAQARWAFLLSRAKSDIAHVLTTELMRVSSGTHFFLQLIATAFIAGIQIALAFCIAPGITLLVAVGGVLFFICLQPFVKKSKQMGQAVSEHTRSLLFNVTEHLNGIKEIKSYGIEAGQIQKFVTLRKSVEQNFILFNTLQSQTDMVYKVGAAICISLFFFSAIEIFKLNPQEFLLIIIIFARIWPRLSAFQSGMQYVVMMLPAFQTAIKLEHDCLVTREYEDDKQTCSRIQLTDGIKFNHVSFAYDAGHSYNAVNDVCLKLPAGTTVAFVGASGSGKSTLVDLLLGLLTPGTGSILLDNDPMQDRLTAWRQAVDYVPQDAFLFHASIRDNLVWICPDATDEEIWRALDMAAAGFVGSLPEGLDTVVGDRGVRLSGGERQRIVLARALLRQPSVLILDEATSSLDTENEQRIQQAIEGLHGKLTIVIVTHRVSTIKNADQIYVMEQGRIVEQGDYRLLMGNPQSRFYALTMGMHQRGGFADSI